MKRSYLTQILCGYLVFSSSNFLNSADLISNAPRQSPVSQPLTIIISTPEEVRLLKAERIGGRDLPEVVHVGQLSKVAGPMKIEFQQLNFDVLESDGSVADAQGKPQVIYSSYQPIDATKSNTEADDPEQLDSPESELNPGSPSDEATLSSEPPAAPEPEQTDVEQDSQMVESIKRALLKDAGLLNTAPPSSLDGEQNEHDVHQPLKLPEAGGVPDVDLKDDPIYKELLHVFKNNVQEQPAFDPLADIESLKNSSEEIEQFEKMVDDQFHAAEKLLKVSRSLEKVARGYKEKGLDARHEQLRLSIIKIRKIAAELTDYYP